QDLADQAMLVMPEVPYPNTSHPKMLGELRTNGFNPFAQPTASSQELRGMNLGHPFTGWGDNNDSLPLFKDGLTKGINEGFIGGKQPTKNPNQVISQLEIVRPGWQQGISRDHARAGNP